MPHVSCVPQPTNLEFLATVSHKFYGKLSSPDAITHEIQFSGWGSALPPRSTDAAYGPDVVGRKSNNMTTKSTSTSSLVCTGSNNHL